MNVSGLDHIGIVVPNLDQSIYWLTDTLRLTAGATLRNVEQGIRLRFVDMGSTRLELIEPDENNAPLTRFLKRHPHGGLHHISLRVGSLSESMRHVTSQGVSFAGTRGHTVEGHPMCFLRPPTDLGVLIELEEHPAKRHWRRRTFSR